MCYVHTSDGKINPLEKWQSSNTWQQILANNKAFIKKYEQTEFRKCLLAICPKSYAILSSKFTQTKIYRSIILSVVYMGVKLGLSHQGKAVKSVREQGAEKDIWT
jgi:hypothetical protein